MELNYKKIISWILLALFLIAGVFFIFHKTSGLPETKYEAPVISLPVNIITPEEANKIFEKQLYTLASSERKVPLIWNDCMSDQAEKRAKYIATNNYFEHTDLSGKFPYEDMIQLCYDWFWAGENLAEDFASPEAAHTALMESPTHRANILNKDFNQMGVGCYLNVCVEFFAN